MNTKLTIEMLNAKQVDCGGISTVIEYAQTFNLEHPKLPSKPILSKNPNSDEALEFALKLKQYETEKADYQSKMAEYNEIRNANDDIIKEFICDFSGLNTIPEQYRDKVYNKAYSDGHSNGYESVYNELCGLVEIFY